MPEAETFYLATSLLSLASLCKAVSLTFITNTLLYNILLVVRSKLDENQY